MQTAVPDGLEVAHDSLGPEPAPNTEPPYLKMDEDKLLRARRQKRLHIFILFCVMTTILGVGLGVGLGLVQQHPSPDVAASIPLINGALNDTSLASVITADKNRHLFFQDVNNTIRHAIFAASQNAWLPSIGFINSPRQPKKYTPISVLDVSNASSAETHVSASTSLVVIDIFYVDVNNTIAAFQYIDLNGNDSGVFLTYDYLLNSSFPVYKDTRSLSVSQFLSNSSNGSASDIFSNVFLLSESPGRNITVLQGSHSGGSIKWTWQNITQSFYQKMQAIPQGAWIGSPFSASKSFDGRAISGCFSNSGYKSNGSLSPVYGATLEDAPDGGI